MLQTIFGFFSRKTDLYHIMKSPDDCRGFPAGKAESLVLKNFRCYAFRESGSPSCENPPKLESRTCSDSSGMSTWNGGVTEKYRWTQTISDLTVEMELPLEVASTKDLMIELRSTGMQVKVRGTIVLDGEFSGKIDVSGSTWMLEDLRRVTFSLEKLKEGWWTSVLVGDAEIDATKVESTKRIEDYDAETQGAIRKILFDENQKRKGLLTSDQSVMAEKLRNAWDAEGSPFKGTPFDANIVRT